MLEEPPEKLSKRYKRSWNYLIWLLSRRDYPEQKLIEKLLKKKVKIDVAKELIQELKDENYFNAENYTHARVRHLAARHYSTRGIFSKLRSERIQVKLSEVETIFEEEDLSNTEILKSFLNLKAPKIFIIKDKEARFKEKQRLLKKCQSRGHDIHSCLEALKSLEEIL